MVERHPLDTRREAQPGGEQRVGAGRDARGREAACDEVRDALGTDPSPGLPVCNRCP